MRITDETIMEVVKSIDKFDSVKDYIFVKAIPIEEVNNDLCNKIIGDVALKISVMIDIDSKEIRTISPSKEVVKSWNISEDDLFDLAFENSKRMFKPKFKSLTSVLTWAVTSDSSDDAIFEDYYGESPFSYEPFVMFSKYSLCGAVFVFDKEIRRKIAEIFGEDYYISFTSRHEAVITPVSAGVEKETLKEVLTDTIDCATDPKDFLYRSVYRYFSKYDVISALVN